MANTSKVKFNNHFKLYILFKDDIIFENELIKSDIEYFKDLNQVGSQEEIRYFLLDDDKDLINSFLLKNNIVASIESLNIADFQHQKKMQYLYLKIVVVVVIILLLVSLCFD